MYLFYHPEKMSETTVWNRFRWIIQFLWKFARLIFTQFHKDKLNKWNNYKLIYRHWKSWYEKPAGIKSWLRPNSFSYRFISKYESLSISIRLINASNFSYSAVFDLEMTVTYAKRCRAVSYNQHSSVLLHDIVEKCVFCLYIKSACTFIQQ